MSGLSCGPPPVEDATSVKVLGRSQLYGERVMFMCRPGLSPTRNPPALTCTENGEWDGVAACAGKTCVCVFGSFISACVCPSPYTCVCVYVMSAT